MHGPVYPRWVPQGFSGIRGATLRPAHRGGRAVVSGSADLVGGPRKRDDEGWSGKRPVRGRLSGGRRFVPDARRARLDWQGRVAGFPEPRRASSRLVSIPTRTIRRVLTPATAHLLDPPISFHVDRGAADPRSRIACPRAGLPPAPVGRAIPDCRA